MYYSKTYELKPMFNRIQLQTEIFLSTMKITPYIYTCYDRNLSKMELFPVACNFFLAVYSKTCENGILFYIENFHGTDDKLITIHLLRQKPV